MILWEMKTEGTTAKGLTCCHETSIRIRFNLFVSVYVLLNIKKYYLKQGTASSWSCQVTKAHLADPKIYWMEGIFTKYQ